MRRNEQRTLPDWIENAYEILVSQTTERHGEFVHDQAQELLLTHDEFSDEPTDAEYAIEYMLNYGWLYEVEGKLRITDPDY